MRRLILRLGLAFCLAIAMTAASSSLRAQTIEVQQSSRLSFQLNTPTSNKGSIAPGGNVQVTVTCIPGLRPCPKGITIYASVDQCGMRGQNNASAIIPASRIQAQINKGPMKLFNQVVPPDREGCGVTLYSGQLPTSQMITVSAAMFIDSRKLNVPIGLYQGSLNIHVETF